jgi:hypothetical protein
MIEITVRPGENIGSALARYMKTPRPWLWELTFYDSQDLIDGFLGGNTRVLWLMDDEDSALVTQVCHPRIMQHHLLFVGRTEELLGGRILDHILTEASFNRRVAPLRNKKQLLFSNMVHQT